MTGDAAEVDWSHGQAYKVEAYYPNSTVPPLVAYWVNWRSARAHALDLSETGEHTSIRVLTPTMLALAQLWGQLAELP
jgi:hypothetical protein